MTNTLTPDVADAPGPSPDASHRATRGSGRSEGWSAKLPGFQDDQKGHVGQEDGASPGHGLLLGDARAEQVDPELASHRRAAPNTTGLDR